MDKVYSRINWENEPSILTPINAANLNRIDYAVDQIDNRVVEMDTTKAKESDALQMFNAIAYDEATGRFTFTRKNGTTVVVDTLLEKVVTNFDYDNNPQSPHYQQLILTTVEGVKYIDLSAFVSQYEFEDSNTVRYVINGGKVKTEIIAGSITENELQPNYLADITAQANIASNSAIKSQSYAVGGTGQRTGENTDNSKYYSEQAAGKAAEAQEIHDDILDKLEVPRFYVDFATGNLNYTRSDLYNFNINTTSGNLEWEVA